MELPVRFYNWRKPGNLCKIYITASPPTKNPEDLEEYIFENYFA